MLKGEWPGTRLVGECVPALTWAKGVGSRWGRYGREWIALCGGEFTVNVWIVTSNMQLPLTVFVMLTRLSLSFVQWTRRVSPELNNYTHTHTHRGKGAQHNINNSIPISRDHVCTSLCAVWNPLQQLLLLDDILALQVSPNHLHHTMLWDKHSLSVTSQPHMHQYIVYIIWY